VSHSGPLKVALVGLNRSGYQSLALGYVRAYAEADARLANKAVFQTLDLTDDLDAWWVAFRVLGLGPDVVAFSVYCWNASSVYEICRVLKGAAPAIRIVVGGPEVGPIAEDVLEAHPEIDAVVRGEGEATFAELLRVYASGKSSWMVEGVTARKGDEVVSTPDRALIEDLDTIPSPYLVGILRPIEGGAYLETYRGCPFDCAYCFEGKGYDCIRSFSRERVKAEVAALVDGAGIRSFSFIDSVFNLTSSRLEWLSEFMASYASRGVRLHTIEVDIEKVDDEAAALLKRCGVASVETGPQSVGAKALEACHRRFDPERFSRGIEALQRVGIWTECDLIVGLPGDDVFDFLAGLRFAFERDPGKVQSSTLHVLPGTELWQRSEELGLVFDPEPPHEIIKTPKTSYLDLRRAEIMSLALKSTYRARV